MNRDQLLAQLRDNQLLSAEELQKAEELFGPDASPDQIVGELVGERVLTPFQVRKVLAGEAKQLVLGQYRLLEELGRGGMGQVFKAFHTIMGRTVALKVLAPSLQGDAVAMRWFEREVRMLTQLQHPNIVVAYDANEANGLHFLVMEYVEGQNLQTLVKKRGPLPIRQACEMMFQSALALQYAHEKGVVHRDIKPANLLIPEISPAEIATAVIANLSGSDEELRPRPPVVKVVDFGLARLQGQTAAGTIVLNETHSFAGTPDFVSPEQCRDVHGVDIRSDLYSLGCTFYYALTGEVPFGGATVTEKLANHLMQPPPPLERLRPDAAEVSPIIQKLMAKNPDDRFATPLALARALQPWCGPVSSWKVPTLRTLKSPWHSISKSTAPIQSPLFKPALFGKGSESYATRVVSCPGTDAAAEAAVEPEPAVSPATVSYTGAAESVATSGDLPSLRGEGGSLQATPPPPKSSALDAEAAVRLLPDVWRQWADVVASFCEQRGRRSWKNERYRELYNLIIAVCQRAAGGPAAQLGLFREIEELVKPWVSLEAFERAETEILESLLAKCRRVEVNLGNRRPLTHTGRLFRLGVAAVLISVVFGLGANAGWRFWLAAGLGKGRLDWRPLLASLQTSSPEKLALLVLPVFLIVVVCLLLRWR